MEAKSIDAYIVQEINLEGNFICVLPKGHQMIHHGPILQPCQGVKGGVTPEMAENWKREGCIVRRGGPTVGGITRLMSADINTMTIVKVKTISLKF